MTLIPPTRKDLHVEGTQFRGAVSEDFAQRTGAAINFINHRQHSEKQFFANGSFNIASSYPQTGVDGFTFFEFDAEIINIWAFVQEIGSGTGTLQMDIKRATSSGGSFDTIFSTQPSFDAGSGSNLYTYIGAPAQAGVISPVLSVTNVNMGDVLRLDLMTVPTGVVQNCGIVVHYRPR